MRQGLWLAVLFVLANLIGLDRSPVVWIDEVTLNDPARELAFHGHLRSSVFAGTASFERVYLWQPPGQALGMAAVYRVFGFGIWQTRLPTLLFAAAALFLLHRLALRLLGDPRAAFLAALAYALDPKLLQVARSGRMDPQCLCLLLLATLLALRALDGNERFHATLALSGLCAGLAGVTHPVAVAWTLGLGLLILLRCRGRRRLLGALAFGAVAALPPALWMAWALKTAGPAVFAAQFLDHGNGHLAHGSLLARLVAELRNYAGQYRLTPLLLLAYAAALVWFLLRGPGRPEAKRTVAVLFGATFLFNALVMTKGLGFYFLYPGAILAICLGAGCAALLPRPLAPPRGLRSAAALSALLLLGLNVLAGGLAGRWLSLAFQWRARDYRPVVEMVRRAVPAGSVVWGPPEVWYAIEETGSSLRLLGPPDPRRHDFLVLRPGQEPLAGERAVKVAELVRPLPAVLGLHRDSADYTLQIWRRP